MALLNKVAIFGAAGAIGRSVAAVEVRRQMLGILKSDPGTG